MYVPVVVVGDMLHHAGRLFPEPRMVSHLLMTPRVFGWTYGIECGSMCYITISKVALYEDNITYRSSLLLVGQWGSEDVGVPTSNRASKAHS